MTLRIAVCVKYVPDATGDRGFADDLTTDREAVDGLLSELDEYAVEQALRISEEADDAEVTVITVGPDDEQVSVVVEGLAQPLAVRLLDPLGLVIATGQALVSGSPESGLDAAIARPGTYTVQVLNPLGLAGAVELSLARTVRVP